MIYGQIYKIFNKVNGKSYIGQTIHSVNARKSSHIYESIKGKCKCIIHKAIKKYGVDNFEWSILRDCLSKDELNNAEIEEIIKNRSHCSEYGYNQTLGGDINPMFDPTIKKKQRESLLISMKKFVGENNVMMRHDVKEKHQKVMENLSKNDGWIQAKAIGDNKQKGVYKITTPDGEELIITGLTKFCKENNLQQSKMSSVSTGNRIHHKGYKCELLQRNKAGEHTKRVSSKEYEVTTPSNQVITTTNLMDFCKCNNLKYASMLATSAGRQKQHKGFICNVKQK